MSEGFDDIEMRNRNMEEEEEGETSFWGDDNNRSINIINTENPRTTRVNLSRETPVNILRRMRNVKSIITTDKKSSFKKIFKIQLEKKNGPNNSILLDKTSFVRDQKGNVSIIFKGEKIGNVNTNNEPELFTRKNKKYVDEFNDYMKKAKKEYEKTTGGFVEKEFEQENPDWDHAGDIGINFDNVKLDIIQNATEKLNESIEYLIENMRKTQNIMSEQDIRELNGVLDPKGRTPEEKINFLEIQAEHWRQKALLEVYKQKERWYKNAELVTRLQADKLRLDNDIRPEEEETVSIIQQEIEESDLTRFERFKQWAKENLLGLSAVAISVAGIITTIVMGARNTLKQGAKAVGNLGKAIANIGKNFGAVISAVLNLISQILSWGAKRYCFSC